MLRENMYMLSKDKKCLYRVHNGTPEAYYPREKVWKPDNDEDIWFYGNYIEITAEEANKWINS